MFSKTTSKHFLLRIGANLGLFWHHIIVWFMVSQGVHSSEAVFPEVGKDNYGKTALWIWLENTWKTLSEVGENFLSHLCICLSGSLTSPSKLLQAACTCSQTLLVNYKSWCQSLVELNVIKYWLNTLYLWQQQHFRKLLTWRPWQGFRSQKSTSTVKVYVYPYVPSLRLQLGSANRILALTSCDGILWVQGIPNVKNRQRESIENAYYRLNKGFRRDKFVIRSVTDILWTQSRDVKCVCRGGRPTASLPPPPPPPQILQTYFGPEVRQKQKTFCKLAKFCCGILILIKNSSYIFRVITLCWSHQMSIPSM